MEDAGASFNECIETHDEPWILGVGRTRPIRPTRADPPRPEPIRADFRLFFTGTG
jgi:hypothetical protein